MRRSARGRRLTMGLLPRSAASETFYGQTAPAKSEQGVGKWLGFSNLMMGAMSGVMASADLKPNDQKKVKALMAAGSIAGAAMALHQVDANGFDKTQTKVATAANMLFGAAAIKDIIDLSK